MDYLQGLPAFAAYFGMGLGFVVLFLCIYLHVTPHRELALIRAGNVAAALAFTGALLGVCLPLASALAHSVGVQDLAIWATVAFVAQLAAYLVVRLLLPGFPARIEAGELSAAIVSMAVHVGIGLVNAAAMVF